MNYIMIYSKLAFDGKFQTVNLECRSEVNSTENETMDRKTKKIFIQRDYSRGTAVRFATDFPRELTGKVDTVFA